MERWLDEKLRDILMNDLKKNNIHVSYEDQLLQVIKAKQGYTLKCASGNLQADLVLASIGIQGSSCLAKDLGIYGQQGIPVNPFMETEIPHIFAAGDVTELPSDYPWGLWHSAELQGYTAGLNMSGIRTSLEKKSFRLKTEVFGNFFFSQNYAQSKDTYPSKTIIDRDNCYLRVFHDRNYLKGALMMNFKGIGKKLQQYIQEEISLKSLYSFLESLELTESES